MFGHSLNPDYFINPPAFTYVVCTRSSRVRWGTDPATIGGAFAADPTTRFALARARFGVPRRARRAADRDRRRAAVRRPPRRRPRRRAAGGRVPAGHYSHFALNDAPTLAPLAAALIGVAGIYRTGRTREYVLAGLGARRRDRHQVHGRDRARDGDRRGASRRRSPTPASATSRSRIGLMCAGFLAANPYALLDHQAFRDGLEKQTETAGEDGGKLGLANTSGWRYYLGTFTWGLGWLPSLFALGGAVGLLARHRRLGAPARAGAAAAVPLPRQPVALLRPLDAADLPDPLPAGGVGRASPLATWLARRFNLRARDPGARARRPACSCRASSSASTTTSCWPTPTRAWVAREWMVREHPGGQKIVVEPIAPDQWAMDVGQPAVRVQGGTGSGNRWNKWRTSRSCVLNGKPIRAARARVVKLEDYERTTRPALVELLRERRVLLGRHRLDAVRARVRGSGRGARTRCAYYDELRKRRGDVVFRVSPYGSDSERVPFSFDYSFNYYPLTYERPGPEIVIYRLHGGDCDPMKRVLASASVSRCSRSGSRT